MMMMIMIIIIMSIDNPDCRGLESCRLFFNDCDDDDDYDNNNEY